MLKAAKKYIREFIAWIKENKQVAYSKSPACEKELYFARIIRLVHSIEKGLSIENPRVGFGYDKIKTIYGWIKKYQTMGDIDQTCIFFAADAIQAYCDYHDKNNLTFEKLDEIKEISKELLQIKAEANENDIYGGVLTVKKTDMDFRVSEVEKLFQTRHSVREFEKGNVPDELIEKAVSLAQTAPSACNRQAVRVYVVDAKKFVSDYTANLQGIGGFADDCDKFILITGKLSAYEEYEYKQFVVSASIFAGYLSLALHGLGLGACVVQRSLRPGDVWINYCKKNKIPLDEQLICMLSVGLLKDETTVPLSKRLDTKKILKHL